ncbi:MAG TPA: ZIP family metal transporter [Candidatus Woesearchaeota archaeon]|nr:ZIP family metal transporter [Candidatus Woesearchaeota archaeon]
MNTLLWVIIATLINGFVAFVGVFSLWVKEDLFRRILMILVAFSAGALLSGAFFHLLAESLEHLPVSNVFAYMMIGFVLFFIIERFLHWHHCHRHGGACEVHPVSYLILFGDGIHNFIDGVIIGVSFSVSVPFGIITTLLIIGHEIPQELGDFGVLVYGGFSKVKALVYNFLSQLTCVIGGVLGYLFSTRIKGAVPFILPFAAGGFIYIAASDLIPELHKEPKLKKSLSSFTFFLIGIFFMFLLKFLFEH